MAEPKRVAADEVCQKHKQREGGLVVCAYDSDEKFRENHLDGAISLDAFRQQLANVPKDREIVFYCA